MGSLLDDIRARRGQTVQPSSEQPAVQGAAPIPAGAQPPQVSGGLLDDIKKRRAASASPTLQPAPAHGPAPTQTSSTTGDWHIGRNIGGIVGGIAGGVLAAGSDMYTAGGALPANVAMVAGGAGIGGMAGQKVEDWIRGTKYSSPMDDLENQFQALYEQALAAGTAEVASAVAQQFAKLGVRGAIRVLRNKELAPPISAPVDIAPSQVLKFKQTKAQLKIAKMSKTLRDWVHKGTVPSGEELKAGTLEGARKRLQEVTALTEKSEQEASRKVTKTYGQYAKVTDPDAIPLHEPGTVVTKPGVLDNTVSEPHIVLTDDLGNVRPGEAGWKTPPVTNKTPWAATLNEAHLEEIQENLQHVYETGNARLLGLDHPLNTLLERIMNKKTTAFPLDEVKQSLSQAERMLKNAEPWKKRIMGEVRAAVEPVLKKALAEEVELAKQQGFKVSPAKVAKGLKLGDIASGQKNLIHGKRLSQTAKEESPFYEQASAEFPKPEPDLAARAEKVAAKNLEVPAWTNHLFTGQNSLANVKTLLRLPGAQSPSIYLRHALDQMLELKDYSMVDKMVSNGVLKHLTDVTDPSLYSMIPRLARKLKLLQTRVDSRTETNIISRALRVIAGSKKVVPPALNYVPPVVSQGMETVAAHADNWDWISKLDKFLTDALSKVPKARPGMIKSQMITSGMRKIATTSAPPIAASDEGGQ